MSKIQFDVVVGNPPYSKREDGQKSSTHIWQYIVAEAFKHAKDGAYILMVHPSGWRNINGKFEDTKKLLLSNQMDYLEIHDMKDGMKTFGVSTRYDFYVIRKQPYNGKTTIKCQDGKVVVKNLLDYPHIPNTAFDEVSSLFAKDDEESVQVYNSSYYSDKRVSLVSEGKHIYPVAINLSVKGCPSMVKWAEHKTLDHYRKKVILTRLGEAAMLDSEGDYGMSGSCFAIIDEPDNLENIYKAVRNKDFVRFMKSINVGGQMGNIYEAKLMALLRKDFWKDYI